ncbi:MAG: hypothetical protein J5851_03835 [Oscillospiraceae bacterium]|nr:hypothetical protein [Oscillospiraceae bacterium]
MKTLAELMQEVAGSEELQKELTAIKDSETLEAFFKKHDCGATAEEFLGADAEGAISDEEVEAVAGGMNPQTASAMIRKRILTFNKKFIPSGTEEAASPASPSGLSDDFIKACKDLKDAQHDELDYHKEDLSLIHTV